MISFGFALQRLLKGLRLSLHDQDFRALALVLVVTILGGSVFYRTLEGWTWTDSIYFAVMTLATISPEGFALTSGAAKVFTVVYVLGGLGVMVSFALLMAIHLTGITRPSAARPAILEKVEAPSSNADGR